MGLSKTEVNLRRLLAAAPQQQNQGKLVHYVATLREQLAEERTPEGLPRVSKAQLNEYSEKIEAVAAKPPSGDRSPSSIEDSNNAKSVKLDAAAHAHIEKHRQLQEDLTDEMVGLARKLKESSLMISRSIKNTEKVSEFLFCH
ncbi:hypothetical protein SASPL_124052 [Salvia splendens]|uniref:Uncharacterized protein n=1 Tax=Salvia splendens TaxID=180675 RepID=A0A8X8XQ91_SALSN|nr:hypothetical protein SASPL_124052 [Salvia splendens]